MSKIYISKWLYMYIYKHQKHVYHIRSNKIETLKSSTAEDMDINKLIQ